MWTNNPGRLEPGRARGRPSFFQCTRSILKDGALPCGMSFDLSSPSVANSIALPLSRGSRMREATNKTPMMSCQWTRRT